MRMCDDKLHSCNGELIDTLIINNKHKILGKHLYIQVTMVTYFFLHRVGLCVWSFYWYSVG